MPFNKCLATTLRVQETKTNDPLLITVVTADLRGSLVLCNAKLIVQIPLQICISFWPLLTSTE